MNRLLGFHLGAVALAVALPAVAVPTVDGYLSGPGEYDNVRSVKWFNEHGSCAGGDFSTGSPGNRCETGADYIAGNQTTGLYYTANSAGELWLYVEAPLSAKDMLWADTGADATVEAALVDKYGDKEKNKGKALDYNKMTGSEKLKAFTGGSGSSGTQVIEANLAKNGSWNGAGDTFTPGSNYGDVKNLPSGISIVEYADSVSWVTANRGCTEALCDQSNVPMSFEFKFSGFTDKAAAEAFAQSITDLEYHLSPQGFGSGPICNDPTDPACGGGGVPAPPAIALMGLGLFIMRRWKIGLVAS